MMISQRNLLHHTWLHVRRHRGVHSSSKCASATSTPKHAGHDSSSSDEIASNQTNARQKTSRPRVVVALSGGVDSSVAAYLLRQPQSFMHRDDGNGATVGEDHDNRAQDAVKADCGGVDVIGLHMSNWNALDEDSDKATTNNSNKNSQRNSSRNNATNENKNKSSLKSSSNSTTFCQASEEEYNDAQSVAQHLSIPLHRVSFASEYWIQVFEPFVESISSSNQDTDNDGKNKSNNEELIMPNPDFGCNTYIKFGAMKEYAMGRFEADYVATGHYAQLWHRNYNTSSSLGSSSRNNCDNGLLVEGNDNFYEWMKESSRVLEESVRGSIAGRPEEEWILNNNPHNSDDSSHSPMLIAGADKSKDQSYFLSGVKAEAFRNVIFPLGHLAKSSKITMNNVMDDQPHNGNINQQQSVRDIALKANIPTASKRDSMGICFIGKRNFGNFVSQYLPTPAQPGNFVDVDTGQVVGVHEGAMHYTVGQGAKISGASVRYFVCGKGGGRNNHYGVGVDTSVNAVFVCNSTHHPALYTDELFVDFDSFNWIGLGGGICNVDDDHIPRPLVEGQSIKLLARTRHLQPLVSCTVTWKRYDGSHPSRGNLIVHFDKPIRAITPGQIVGLYAGSDGLICLGGGPIKGRGTSFMERGADLSLSALHPSGHNDLSLSFSQ